MTYIKVLLKVCRVQHYLIRKSHAALNPPSPTPHLCFDPIWRTLWGPLALDELWVLCSRVCLLMFLGAQALSRSLVVGGFFLSHSPNPRTSLVMFLGAQALSRSFVVGGFFLSHSPNPRTSLVVQTCWCMQAPSCHGLGHLPFSVMRMGSNTLIFGCFIIWWFISWLDLLISRGNRAVLFLQVLFGHDIGWTVLYWGCKSMTRFLSLCLANFKCTEFPRLLNVFSLPDETRKATVCGCYKYCAN